MPGPAEAVGVDGCRQGWAVAAVRGGTVTWSLAATFAEIVAAHDCPIAVDMPMSVRDGVRACDLAARRWLREHGGSWQSVFLTPSRATVDAHRRGSTHAEAMAARGSAQGTSIQAWNLVPKIIEVLDVAGERVIEAHPECSFRMMGPSLGRVSKKSADGLARRRRILAAIFDLPAEPVGAPLEDLLDATAVAWTALRVVRGEAISLPPGAMDGSRIVV